MSHKTCTEKRKVLQDQTTHLLHFLSMSKRHPPQTVSLANRALHTRLMIRIQSTWQISRL